MRNTEKQPSFWSGRTNKRFVLLFLLRFFFLLVELKILVAQLLDDCVEIHTLNGEKPPPAWRLAHAASHRNRSSLNCPSIPNLERFHVVLLQILHVRHVVADGVDLVNEQEDGEDGEQKREQNLDAQKE